MSFAITTELRTNLIRIVFLIAVPFALPWNVLGQGFINLNFESTVITPVVFPGGTRYVATVPDWTWTPVENGVNGDPNTVAFNDIALDDAAVTLQGITSPFYPAIQGNYSILLQGGSTYSEDGNGASIGQTARIPNAARSITYWGGALQVTFNGQALSFTAVNSGPNYTVWSADISAYAGQTGQLLFTVPWQDTAELDNIQFSTASVPEPCVLKLLSVCGLCVWWFMKLPKKETCSRH